jgi:predicted ABC-type ATPase
MEALMKLLNIPYLLVKQPLEKAGKRNDGHLIAVKKQVVRDGHPAVITYYKKPEDIKREHLKRGQTFQIHDKEGVKVEHRGKHFAVDGPDEKKKGNWNIRHEDGRKESVHEKHILKHATPVEGKRLGDPAKSEPIRKWQNKLSHLPEDTAEHWKQKGGGDYPVARKLLHEQIIQDYLDHVEQPAKGEQPVAILMAGGTAAGKSTVLKHLMDDDMSKRFVMVDPDGIKEKLPEYQEATKASARNAAVMVHEESSGVAKDLRGRAIDQGKHVVIDGTMKDPIKYGKLIDDLKKKGYKVNVFFVDIDIDQAIHFAEKRAERTGRWVPPALMREIYPEARKSFLQLKDYADDFKVFDRRQGTPSLVWDKQTGIRDHHSVNTIFGGQ